MSVGAWIALALIGGVGSVVRFRLDAAVSADRKGAFPLGTLVVNTTGAFVIGLLTGAGVTGTWSFVFATGFLGSFTTFSTWMFETERLAEDGEGTTAVANLAISVVTGLLAAGAGWALGAVL